MGDVPIRTFVENWQAFAERNLGWSQPEQGSEEGDRQGPADAAPTTEDVEA